MLQRIDILLDSRGPGGIETHVGVLAGALNKVGVNSRVVFLDDHGPHRLKDDLVRDGLEWITAGGTRGLWSLLRSDPPDVLHTHGYKAGILGRLLATARGVPVVSTYHAGERGGLKMSVYQFIDRYTSCLSDNIAVSTGIASALPSFASVIDNFVTVPNTAPRMKNSRRRVAFVGRLSHEKGPDLFCALAARVPKLQFDVYGDGPMRVSLENSAPRNVVFHGMQSCMKDIWPQIDLLCMPSRAEGLPMAALEAMAIGVPVACFAVGGLPCLVANGENGFLAPPGELGILAYRLDVWSSMPPDARVRMSRKAKSRVSSKFSESVQVPKVLKVYERAFLKEPGIESR